VIESVHAGEGAVSPVVARRLIALVAGDSDAAARHEDSTTRMASLTAREREVASAVAEGLSNAEIGHRLHMSLATFKAHVSRLFTKFALENRVQVSLRVHEASGFIRDEL
jgi:DNA-binding NarL/FixJ family response regulator